MDASTLLSQIEAAISALLTGGVESYSIGDRSVTKLDLATLFQQRNVLQTEVARSAGSGAFFLAKLGPRT